MKQHRMRSRNSSLGRSPCGCSWPIHALWRSRVCSPRCRKYGIHPMSPSVSANLSFGKRCQKSAHSRSPSVKMLIAEDRFMGTGGGASGAVDALFEDDPTWQHSTVPVSEHAANKGSHASVWMLGMPRPAGFSENVTA